jgi:hypothetical protein
MAKDTVGTAEATEADRQTGHDDGTSGQVGVGIATGGDIRAMGVLDLLHATPEDLERTTSISDVGTVLVRESMAGRLGAIPMHKVGAVVAVPDGGQLVTNMGVAKLTGEALAASGHEDEILLVVGPLVVTTAVERVAYRRLVVVGVLVAPKGSEAALSGVALTGVSTFYTLGAAVRTVIGEERWGREFFEELPEPVTLVIVGAATVEPGVTRDLLREKVTGIALVGVVRAPKELVPILQVLSADKVGEITVLEPEEAVEVAGG